MDRLRFAKGHGAGNDFVVLPDPGGALPITPQWARALCDRRRGIGADGVLRAVAAAAHPEGVSMAGDAGWFMDYWNADGSLSEMCGNGVRVFSRYLVGAGMASSAQLAVATRGGVKAVRVDADEVTVDMGAPRFLGDSVARIGGQRLSGVGVSMGNPHLVCGLSADQLVTADLRETPEVDLEMFPTGVNVELSALLAPGHMRTRVRERGVGETHSCGTGACAVAAAALRDAGQSVGEVVVDMPGGRLIVTVDAETSWLAGPAVIVAEGTLSPDWLLGARSGSVERAAPGPSPRCS